MILDSRTKPVHEVLEKWLEPATLAYALRLWHRYYVRQQHIDLDAFVDAIDQRQSLPVERQQLLSELRTALLVVQRIMESYDEATTGFYVFPDYDQVAPSQSGGRVATSKPDLPTLNEESVSVATGTETLGTESSVQTATTPEQVQPDTERPVQFIVFSALIQRLTHALSTEQYGKLLVYIHDELIQCCREDIAMLFYEWLQSGGEYFEHPDMDMDCMHRIVHTFYMGLCQYLGPVEADTVLMDAVKTVDGQYGRDEFDVYGLL